ncbi:MAG: hypothetical protein KDN22_24115 [Verrucomicrobiae bacterium]|nr:hypothetical protein [Verrucomicrobiae bacterium]
MDRRSAYPKWRRLYQLLTGWIPGRNARPPSAVQQDAAPFDVVAQS